MDIKEIANEFRGIVKKLGEEVMMYDVIKYCSSKNARSMVWKRNGINRIDIAVDEDWIFCISFIYVDKSIGKIIMIDINNYNGGVIDACDR